jgi:hypothetical protein
MAMQIVPLTSNNQTFNCQLSIDGTNKTFIFSITYNTPGGYWFMSISDSNGVMLLDSIPLLVSDFPAADLLGQYTYLKIGSAAVVPTSTLSTSVLDDTNLGSDYVLVWTDTIQ